MATHCQDREKRVYRIILLSITLRIEQNNPVHIHQRNHFSTPCLREEGMPRGSYAIKPELFCPRPATLIPYPCLGAAVTTMAVTGATIYEQTSLWITSPMKTMSLTSGTESFRWNFSSDKSKNIISVLWFRLLVKWHTSVRPRSNKLLH